MAVVDRGRVIAEGTSRDLKASVGSNTLHLELARADQHDPARAVVAQLLGDGFLPDSDPTALGIKLRDAAIAPEVLGALARANIALAGFSLGAPSLDDVFFALTGRAAEETPAERAQTKEKQP